MNSFLWFCKRFGKFRVFQRIIIYEIANADRKDMTQVLIVDGISKITVELVTVFSSK